MTSGVVMDVPRFFRVNGDKGVGGGVVRWQLTVWGRKSDELTCPAGDI